jgi:hypothetical protein
MAYAVLTLAIGFIFWHTIEFGIINCILMGMLALAAWFHRKKPE